VTGQNKENCALAAYLFLVLVSRVAHQLQKAFAVTGTVLSARDPEIIKRVTAL
jgi:hypothetical protein